MPTLFLLDPFGLFAVRMWHHSISDPRCIGLREIPHSLASPKCEMPELSYWFQYWRDPRSCSDLQPRQRAEDYSNRRQSRRQNRVIFRSSRMSCLREVRAMRNNRSKRAL